MAVVEFLQMSQCFIQAYDSLYEIMVALALLPLILFYFNT